VVATALGSSCNSQKAEKNESTRTVHKAPTFAIHSSLEGKRVLPGHIRWIATVSPRTPEPNEVRFLIDGKLGWIDRDPPYMYGGDGGYLVTTWLGSGEHEFTTSASTRGGSSAASKVVASVREPKHWCGGVMGRDVTGVDQQKSGLRIGRKDCCNLVFLSGELWIAWADAGDGKLHANAYEYWADKKTLRILAPIQKTPEGTFVSQSGYLIGGSQCQPGGSYASYSVSTFTARTTFFGKPEPGYFTRLTAKRDPCPGRRAILEGAWLQLD